MKRPTPLRKLNPRISPELEGVVARAMRKNPGQRYTSIRAFAEELDRLIQDRRYEGRQGLAKVLVRRWLPLLAAGVICGLGMKWGVPRPVRPEPADFERLHTSGFVSPSRPIAPERMKERYLEITFLKGKAVAAYLHLPRLPEARRAAMRELGPGLRLDLSEKGDPMGIEIISPAGVRADDLNDALRNLGHPPLSAEELAPIRAA